MKILAFLICIFCFSAQAKDRVVVFIGDSLTAGYGVDKQFAYPSIVEKKLKLTHPDVIVKNAGISGATSASASKRLKWMLKLKPEIVVLALGANDGLRGFPPSATYKNLEQAILLANKNNAKVILAGMLAPPNYGAKYTKDFKDTFIKLKNKHNVTFIPFLLDGVAGEKKYNQEDGIHPNEKGQEKIANTVLPYLNQLLGTKK